MDNSIQHQGESLDHLLSDWLWLGELAGRIVRDAGLADDARQAAWLSMWAEGPNGDSSRGRNRRTQLYWAVKSFASNARTGEKRRARRERMAAQGEALPSTEELVHRGEQRQRVWDSLKALPEPLRGTLLLHYQDGLAPAEIAARSGAKADTVRRRIQRGVQELRERLDADREGGGVLALAAAMPSSRAEPGAAAAALAPPSLFGITFLAGATMLVKSLSAFVVVAGLILVGRAFVSPEPSSGGSELARFTIDDQVEELPSVLAGDEAVGDSPTAMDSRISLDTSGAPAPSLPTVAHWAGAVAVYDPEGVPLPMEVDGVLSANISYERNGGVQVEIPFQSGQFELTLEAQADGGWGLLGSSVTLPELPIGALASEYTVLVSACDSPQTGPLVHMESGASPTVGRYRALKFGSEDVTLHVRTIAPVVLNVVDARNGSIHLSRVDVIVAGGSTDRAELANRSRPMELALLGDSPITLVPAVKQACQRSVGCFIHSPGFASKRVDIDLSDGGERTFELDPGGDLEVRIQGEVPPDTYLRVWLGEERWAPFADLGVRRKEEFSLTGLPLGPVTVRIEKGSYYSEKIVLAEEQVLIQQNARASVLLLPRTFVTPLAVEVEGELTLPVSWDLEDATLIMRRTSPTTGSEDENSFLRVSELAVDDQRPGHYRFSAGKLVPGDYVASLLPIEYKTAFTVPPEGLFDLRVDVPPPVTVTVTIRDSLTGEISDLAKHISWLPVFDGNGGFTTLPRAARDEATKRIVVQVTAGPVELSTSSKGIARVERVVEAIDGLSIDLVVERVPRATLEFEHGGSHVPWPSDFSYDGALSQVDGDGELLSRGSSQAGIQFTVTQPGRYRLLPPKVEGFKQPEPIEIDMTVEEEQRVVVELTAE